MLAAMQLNVSNESVASFFRVKLILKLFNYTEQSP
jgi:hypothetical protein